ncbi:GGDEF domain-containing response regulator [Shewanella aestuarii]|uniref:diguanylate cyclase n=1 Tax=Shewanella aestuarii TaxID=1028752 RepID=A0A6G9QK78_9GAMM|nr:diguanylate cyclase [Shewanella aestuarii]QIR14974.1 diguanylate cyclase [Shewanella aestuarii]
MDTFLINTQDKSFDILIVDDDHSVVMALRNVLNDLGRVRFAQNAVQAFEMISDISPDLILLDIDLPDKNGLDICRDLKKEPDTSDIPVLFITSQVGATLEREVFSCGGADYISKPLNPYVVAARVNTHLNYRHLIIELNKMAMRDGLTGVNNRRSLDEKLKIEYKRSFRDKTPLTVAMIDVDEFKKYNDYFGHIEGDECLKRIASTIQLCGRRPADFIARYGGEEFVLILPNTDKNGAYEILTHLLQMIAQLNIEHTPEAKYDHVTVSVGYSTFSPEETTQDDADDKALLSFADKALFQAKQQGRDQICYL